MKHTGPFPPITMASTSSSRTVYRSLPVAASPVQFSRMGEMPSAPAKQTASFSTSAPIKPAYKFPAVPFECMLQNPLIKEEVDVEELQRTLSKVCATCELRRTPSICELSCTAMAEDGNEQCKFTISIWTTHHEKILLQVDRLSGCPFFFRQTIAKTLMGKLPEQCKLKRLFRAPPLPESLKDESPSEVDVSSVESAIAQAISEVHEQRIQGALVLADLCAENPNFASVFKSINGVERIACLKNDSNSYVKRAVSRILVSV